MPRDLDRPFWRGQRPWFEIWFAVLLDENRRRALWIRETLFVPKEGDGRATIWGAWFDADASPTTRTGKRWAPIETAKIGDPNASDELIRIDDAYIGKSGAAGAVDELSWQAKWWGGKPVSDELPAWLPTPTHARQVLNDAETEATITVGNETIALRGRVLAMHLWGKRRVPTLHWIWTPWLGDGALEVTAISLRDRFSLGLSSLTLDGPDKISGTPATAAHPHGLLTATVAGARRLMHAHAWAEIDDMVGYVYRDTDGSDLMVAQSDIGSAHFETFSRTAPGAQWKLTEERRTAGGVAVEIHQRAPLPNVDYVGWDDTTRKPRPAKQAPRRPDQVEWPAVQSIVALGMTYADHIKETGGSVDPSVPPSAFMKHLRTLAPSGDARVPVPTTDELLAALAEVEPKLDVDIRKRMSIVPAVMDYEGELAVIALGDIDDERLAAGVAQPFGLAACNDLTARICQVFGEGMPRPEDYWACAKSFVRFLPVADRVWAPEGGLAKIPDLTLVTRVNGEERQHASTKDLMYDLPAIVRVARMQLGRPLARGDVIITGTPSGIGMRLNVIRRRFAKLVKDRFRKADFL
ncbi:MAG TPA: fumarylacetoacetate hydrolase family protein, partial [Kofleriaceae bacterium]|nr:fumarylacetoacetate hydrolase family protein [Kofleriaceae bacterium]